MADHFVDDEADELLAEVGVEMRVFRQCAQARDLAFFPAGVGSGQVGMSLVFTHSLGDPKTLGEHVDQRGVDIVDAGAKTREYGIGGGGFLAHGPAR